MEEAPEGKMTWWQVIISDPDNITGMSLSSFLHTLIQTTPAPFVSIIGAEWLQPLVGPAISTRNGIFTLRSSELIERLQTVSQLDWATFLFFDEVVDVAVIQPPQKLCDWIALSKYAVSAVDNNYFYLYTPDKSLVDTLKGKYMVERVREEDLTNLDYPH